MKRFSLLIGLACSFQTIATAQVTKPLAFPDLVSPAGSETNNWYKDYVGVGFSVVTPSSIAGPKVFTMPSDWGGQVTTPILNVPVAIAEPDSSGCTPLTPGSMTGKVAMIYRGNCEFGAKAKAGETAGATAVIIVNNIGGGPVGMGAGAVGNQVTIPVIMISQADGQAIASEINNGQTVEVSFTTWGVNAANDLGILISGASQWHAKVAPLSQMGSNNGNPIPLKAFDGAYIANLGTADQSNVQLKSTLTFQPTSGTAQTVHMDSFMFASFPQSDSILAVGIPGSYDIHPTSTGTYTTSYELSMANTDDFPGDNAVTNTFSVSEDIYCKSRYDFVNNRPIANIGYRYSSTSVATFLAGNLFYVPVGNYGAVSAQYTVSKDVRELTGETSSVYLFKWTDNVVQDSMVEAGELELVGANTINHTNQDTSGQFFEQTFQDPNGSSNQVILDSNSWYYVAVELGNSCFLGYDGQTNYLPRTFLRNHGTGADQFNEFFQVNYTSSLIDLLAEQPNALISNFAFDGTRVVTNETIDSASYAKQAGGLVASIAFKITKNVVNSVDNIKKKTADIVSYPNPASDIITFDVNTLVNSKDLEYTVFSVVGQRMESIVHKNINNGSDKLVLDVSKYSNGNYMVLVKSKEGVIEFVKFSVVH